ncbi:hypothetical protein ACJJTC_019604 [Scirpophaga incertulas]
MDAHIEYSMFQAIRPHYERIAKYSFIDMSSPCDKHTLLYNLPSVLVWILLIIYNVQHLIKVIQYRHDTDAMIKTVCIFLTTFIALIKQLGMSMHMKRVQKLYDSTKGTLLSPKNSRQKKILEVNEKKMAKLQNLYFTLVMVACTLQSVYPLMYRARGQEVELIIYFPIDIRQSPIFEFAVVYCNGMLTIQAYIDLMIDCTVVTLYAQISVQLTLLRDNLLNMVDSYEDEGGSTQDKADTCALEHENMGNDATIRRRLIQCIQHHQKIVWFIKEVESVTAITVAAQFFGTAWIICMIVYRMVSVIFFTTEFLSMFIYFTCMLWQLYMYSYYGTQVKVESEFVCQSAYCSKWLAMSPGTRRQLLTVMTVVSVSAKPITLLVAKIVPITLQTYISVLRASYTLFTVLNEK